MFSPGFAQIGRLLDGATVARKCGVNVGDCIVAVNGSGYRRFAADFKEEELENLSGDSHMTNDNNVYSAGTGEGKSVFLIESVLPESIGVKPHIIVCCV